MMRTKRRVIALVTTAAAALVPFGENVANAHTRRYGTDATLAYRSGAFRGSVLAATRPCRNGRRVNVYKRRRGPDRFIGATISRRGRFSVPAPRRRGRYYAVVTRKVYGSYGHRHTCLRGVSNTVRIRRR